MKEPSRGVVEVVTNILPSVLVALIVCVAFERRQSRVDEAQWRSIDAAGLAGGCRCRDADDPVPSPRSSSGPSRPSVR